MRNNIETQTETEILNIYLLIPQPRAYTSKFNLNTLFMLCLCFHNEKQLANSEVLRDFKKLDFWDKASLKTHVLIYKLKFKNLDLDKFNLNLSSFYRFLLKNLLSKIIHLLVYYMFIHCIQYVSFYTHMVLYY